LFSAAIYQIRGIRRCGSAAIDLCYVAEGIYELFWEYNLQPWDTAAGVLIVEEAGGQVSSLTGEPDHGRAGHMVATNGLIHDEFLRIAIPYVS